jgi:acyl transferase domain-containing protein
MSAPACPAMIPHALIPPTPIAIVGMGMRLPGGIRDLSGLEALLFAGATALAPLPASRWDGARYGPRAPVGAFLDDVDRFDGESFGVSPREARELDPQQRLLLEVGAEALEDAGATRTEWAGSATGVYTGMLAADYTLLQARTRGLAGIDPYYATGKELSFGGGRLAHHFDLHGPALTLATACSSSLAAVHLACVALRTGEVDAALAGGVSMLLAPELSVFMDRVGALSQSGRCRPFDAAADGVVRGEGCALVVLKRLEDAVRDGDHVHAVVRGSALGHDGHSAGLTVPNTAAQLRLGRAALHAADLQPADIDIVEAHATGTPLGDPIELAALAELHAGRPAPLPVGSHKANLGHLDAAAGVVGLLKAIGLVSSGRVPPQPGLEQLTTRVAWDGTLAVLPEGGRLRAGTAEDPLRAAVSAFGLSGTNVQAIVEAPPAPLPTVAPARPQLVLPLSARTPAGLRARATQLADLIERAPQDAARVVGAGAARRDHPEVRAAVHGTDTAALANDLRAISEPHSASCADGVVLVLSGQGAQWPGMGADLLAAEPVFREAIEACDALARPLCGWSIVDELRARPGRIGMTEVAQPLVFAVQVGLLRLLESLGVVPAAIVGQSMGEVAAGHGAGALSLEDAVDLIVRRGRALEAARDRGGMLAAALPAEELEAMLAELGSEAVLAADNGPRATVASGPDAALQTLGEALRSRGIVAVRLPGRYPFHGPLIAAPAAALRAELGGLVPVQPTIPLLSSVTGGEMPPPDAGYWEANATQPVRLWPALAGLLEDGDPLLVELGPHPVLRGALSPAARRPVLPTLQRGADGPTALSALVAGLHANGASVDWCSWTGGRPVNVPLPPPEWRDQRTWLQDVVPGQQEPSSAVGLHATDPLTLIDADGRAVGRLLLDGGHSGDRAGGPAPVPAAATEPDTPTAATRAEDATQVVCAAVRAVLDLPADRPIPSRRSLFDLGLDSVSAVELAGRLSTAVGAQLPQTVAFEHPTLAQLTAALPACSPPSPPEPEAPEPPATEPPAPEPQAAPAAGTGAADPIAVVGMACRVPGASSPAELWSLLAAGRCSVGELPAARRARDGWDAVDTPTRAGLLDEVTGVDCAFLGVSPREADGIDPQQRLFLEVAWEALADAGVADADNGDVGVYVGLNGADYGQRIAGPAGDTPAHFGTGTSFAATAGRLSHLLGLRGPSLAVDTACSASLTAVHLACQALRAGECAMAVAGGANVLATPAVSVAMSRAGALAPDGRCKTFAEEADGYGRGEGAGALVLRPLRDALAAGDRVHAVLLGSAVNQDGASGGLTIPSAEAQVDVVRRALRRAGRPAEDVDYVEAHGTGTRLGDPIELRALGEVFAGRKDAGPAIGSAKANLGHLEAAAGVTGLIKVIAALGAGELPGHLLHGTPTTRVDWDSLPLRLAAPGEPWTGPGRLAGVSAFGFTGSNAHVVVGAAPERAPRTRELPRPFVLPLSAAGDNALRAQAGALADHIEAGLSPLADIVYTLCRRRIDLADRAVVLAGEPAEAIAALRALETGADHPSVVRDGDADTAGPPVHQAARRWIAGADGDWSAACPERGEVVALPAYPWQRRLRWWGGATPPTSDVASASPAAPEPAAPVSVEEGVSVRDAVIAWTAVDAPVPTGGARLGLVGDPDDRTGTIAAALRAAGTDARVWPVPDAPDPATWRSVLDAAAQEGVPAVALVAADAGGRAAAQLVAAGRAALAQTGARTALALLGEGAFAGDADQARAWEVGRVLAMEAGDAWRCAIDAPEADAAAAAAALTADRLDDQLRLADGVWRGARLRPLAPTDTAPTALDPQRWHAVTGADSPAGRSVLAWLRSRGARRLLVGLRQDAPAATAGELPVPHPAPGATTTHSVRDDELPALAGRLAADGALATIVHCPTPVPSAPLGATAPEDARGEAETALLRALDEVTRTEDAPMLVVLGQGASTWGALGATGAALVSGPSLALVAARAPHAPARLLGALVRAGVAELDARQADLLAEAGVGELSEQQLHAALDRLLAGDEVARTCGQIDLRRYVALSQQLAPRALLDELEQPAGATTEATALRRELEALDREERERRLTDHVGACAADALSLDEAEVGARSGLFDLGLDSIMALSLKTRLERDLAPLELPAALTVELPTPAALGAHLAELLDPAGPPAPAEAPAVVPRTASHDDADPPTDDVAPSDDDALAALEAALASAHDLLAQGASR